MPRTPRNSPNPPGRPPKAAEATEAATLADRTGMPKAEAAKRAGVAPRTARRHAAAKRQAGKGAPAKRPAAGRAPAPPSPPSPPAGSQGALGPIDRLRGYAAHDPPALAALEELLTAPEEGLGRDELLALREGLVLAAGLVREASDARKGGTEEDDGRLLRALQRLEGLGKTVATVKAKRPPTDGPDEATRRILAARERAVERIAVLVGNAAEAFAQRRAELGAWAEENLGPVLGAEVRRRVGVMLGEKPADRDGAA